MSKNTVAYPNSTMCETPFFISFFERSGSTFLSDLLDSHPDISCLREVFHEFRSEEGWTFMPQFATREAIRAKLKEIYTKQYKASGFKYKYPTQHEFYPDVYEYLLENADNIRVIFLYRKNLLKASISKQNQIRLIEMGKDSNLTKQEYIEIDKLYLDIDKALAYMHFRKISDEKFYKELIRFKYTHVITYEDLLNDTISTINNLFSFLNVDSKSNASAKTVKITNDNIKEALINYEELVQKLTGTEYEHLLFPD